MAAGFLRLASVSVVEASEPGFAVLAGLLLDTCMVEPLLVPTPTRSQGVGTGSGPAAVLRAGSNRLIYARRLGARVGTGSSVKKSSRILLQRSGFSTSRPCEVPGMTASSLSGMAR